MNFISLDNSLALELGDPSGSTYSSDTRQSALFRAALEYSRYRPMLRQFRTGFLGQACAAGATNIYIVGGPFVVGDSITIGSYPETSETATVTAIGSVPVGGIQPEAILSITVSALTYSHSLGSFIQVTPQGLQLVPSQGYYPLPLDFVKVEQESFDLAVGAKSSVKRGLSFYDASYALSNELSGVGISGQMNYGPVAAANFPIAGNPYNNPNSGMTGTSMTGTTFRFLQAPRPTLIVSPAPTVEKALNFFYYGGHSFDTLPDSDIEPILNYAKGVVFMAQAGMFGGLEDYGEDDANESPSKNAETLSALAKECFGFFDTRIRYRPYCVSG